MRASPTIFFEFGSFCLDPALPLLMRDGQPVPLPPKTLETLVALVERGGRVVSREELIEAVWPDVEVEENNLSVNVSILRKALGGANGGENYIETVPRRGYRFTPQVRERSVEAAELIYTRHTRSQILIEETNETDAQMVTVEPVTAVDLTQETSPARASVTSIVHSDRQPAKLGRWPLVLTIVAVVSALAAGAGLFRRASLRDDVSASGQKRVAGVVNGTGAAEARSLAVLPFRNAALGDYGARNTSVAGELTDAVMARLGASGDINLTPQNALLSEKMTPNNLLIAGRALHADAVLSGALFYSDPEEVYLRLHLVSTGGGEVLWAETFKHPRGELPSLLDSIARGVEEGLQRLASAEEYERRANHYTSSREAYQLYLQARFVWEQRHDVFDPNYQTFDEPAISLNQLEQALALDPNFALAHVGLADYYKTHEHSSKTWQSGEEHALKAVALDPALAEARATLGFIRMFHYWDWSGAESEFKRALELDPGCVTAHQWYALFHSLRGNDGEAIKEIMRARELAPYSLSLMLDTAEMQYHACRGSVVGFSVTVASLRHVLMLHPNSTSAQVLLMQTYWMSGDYEKAAALVGWQGSSQEIARRNAGPRKGSRDFDNIAPRDSYNLALWHSYLNQREEALDLLERAYREHHFFIIYIKAEPFFDNLRDEPRFQDLLKKVGLES